MYEHEEAERRKLQEHNAKLQHELQNLQKCHAELVAAQAQTGKRKGRGGEEEATLPEAKRVQRAKSAASVQLAEEDGAKSYLDMLADDVGGTIPHASGSLRGWS